jgi:hypothetical protein
MKLFRKKFIFVARWFKPLQDKQGSFFKKRKKRKIIFRNSKIYDFSKIEYFGDSFPNLFYNFIGKFGSDLTNKAILGKKVNNFFF